MSGEIEVLGSERVRLGWLSIMEDREFGIGSAIFLVSHSAPFVLHPLEFPIYKVAPYRKPGPQGFVEIFGVSALGEKDGETHLCVSTLSKEIAELIKDQLALMKTAPLPESWKKVSEGMISAYRDYIIAAAAKEINSLYLTS